jgi:GT2 family glycosyltransferase
MQVSIVILNYNHPHNISRLLPTLKKISGVEFEVIVVDNGSAPDVTALLCRHHGAGDIDKLVLNEKNKYFSEGNNIGVREADPSSEFFLLLNSDTEILDGTLLLRLIEWAEGVPETLFPYEWSTCPTKPKDIKRGIVSVDWGRDFDVPGHVRPEGWCTLIRREAWRDMDGVNYPMCYGELQAMSTAIREGHACGCLCQYGKYIKHHHGGSRGSRKTREHVKTLHNPDPDKVRRWFRGLTCESLDFTLGPNEHQSYMGW